MLLIAGALALAGGVLYAVFRRPESPSERIVNVALSPLEAVGTAIAVAPWIIGLVVVIAVVAIGFTIVRFGPKAVAEAVRP